MLKGVQDTRTTPQAYVDALRTWLLERNTFCDVLVSQLQPFYDAYPHFRGRARASKKKRCIEGSSVLVWHARRLHDDSTRSIRRAPHTPPPEPKKGGGGHGRRRGSAAERQGRESSGVMLCGRGSRPKGVRIFLVGDLGKFFDAHAAFKLKKWLLRRHQEGREELRGGGSSGIKRLLVSSSENRPW